MKSLFILTLLLIFCILAIMLLKQGHTTKDRLYNDSKKELSLNIITVLKIYEVSGIKLPFDIIEELEYLNIDSKTEIYSFIENQRQHWKLENTKKPYKKL